MKSVTKGLWVLLLAIAIVWGVVMAIGLAYEQGHNNGYNAGWNDGTAHGWQGCIEENNLYERYQTRGT